jgi:hypothetical protein
MDRKNRRRYAQKSADKAEKLPAIAVKRFESFLQTVGISRFARD